MHGRRTDDSCCFQDSAPVASIITLAYKNSLVYKYGCSDSRFNNLGGTPFLFWQAIGEARRAGIEEFDLGRSGLEDPGLASFKGHLGGAESELNYYRYSTASPKIRRPTGALRLRQIFARMPDAIFTGSDACFTGTWAERLNSCLLV